MADIRQAGFWLKEGKSVRRKNWGPKVRFFSEEGWYTVRLDWGDGSPVERGWVIPQDILADDWEVIDG